MSQRDQAIEELVVRARAGQQTALAELLDWLAEDMQRAAQVELQAVNSPRDPRDVWERSRRDAQARFTEFQGHAAAEVTAWLEGVVVREIRLARQERSGKTDLETIGPSAAAANVDTIVPASPVVPANSVGPANPIGPANPVKPPAAGGGTVHKSSDKTRILKSPADATPPDGSEQSHEEASGAETRNEAVDPYATVADLNVTFPPEVPVTPRPATPALDLKNFGDYEILSEIARGGMGVVYQARDRKLNRKVGLKMILAGQLANPEDIERFYIEAQAAAILRHKNIVGIHQVGEHDGKHYFSMDYIEGKSLSDMIADGPLDPHDAARYMRKVAAAIQYAHDLDVLHRDLKPSNVLVDQRDEPLVTDFGLAKRTQQKDPTGPGGGDSSRQEGGSMVTMAGAIMGTPGYMPPEQAAGRVDEISARSDVYSLGATLYDLIIGHPPIVGQDAWDTVKRVQQEDPVPPRELDPRISLDLNAICLKCLDRDPQSRYATAQELADDLQRFLADMPVTARETSRSERAWRWCRRNPRVASLAALSLMLFVTAFLGISLGYVRTRAALAEARTSIDQMRRAIDTLYTEVSNTDALNEPGLKPFRQKLLSRARDLYDEALQRLGDDPALKKDLAGSHFTLARILLELESPVATLETLQTAETMVSELLAEDPQDVELVELAGRIMNLKGEVLRDTGRLDDSLDAFDLAIKRREELKALAPDEYEFQRQLINSQMNRGLIHKTMFVRPHDIAHYEEATKQLKQSQDDRDRLVNEFPDVAPLDARIHFDSASGAYNLADLKFLRREQLWSEQDDLEGRITSGGPDGGDLVGESVDELEKQLEQIAAQMQSLENESLALLNTAFDELDLLNGDDAKKLRGIEELDSFRTRFLRALCWMLLGKLTYDIAVAESHHQRADEILSQLLEDNPTVRAYRDARAGNYMLIADLQAPAEAFKSYGQAILDFDELVKQFPSVESYRTSRAAAKLAQSDVKKWAEQNQETK